MGHASDHKRRGHGNSQYSGIVSLNTNWNGSAYELYDTVRGMNFKTYNLDHATTGTGSLYEYFHHLGRRAQLQWWVHHQRQWTNRRWWMPTGAGMDL